MQLGLFNPEKPLPYESINVGLDNQEIIEAMQSYMGFLTLPESERMRLRHFDDQKPRTGHSGYAHKSDTDTKHIFHMTQVLDQNLELELHTLPSESREFIIRAGDMYYTVAKAVRARYEQLEDEFPGLSGIHFPRGGKLAHHMRFLAYEDNGTGVLARGHYDKGTSTIALAESHGGLRLGYNEDDLQLLDRDQFDPIMFYGYGWHQLAEMLDVDTGKRAAWHDVVDTGETVDETVQRWSLIYFVDPANMYLESTKQQTHTPIPWRGFGSLALRSDNQSYLVE